MRHGTSHEAEQTYQRHLSGLQQWVGWFALIHGRRLGGVFPTFEAATAAWMAMYGPVPALIRRIELTPDRSPPTVATASRTTDTPSSPPPASAGPETEPEHPPGMKVVCNWAFPASFQLPLRPTPRSYAA